MGKTKHNIKRIVYTVCLVIGIALALWYFINANSRRISRQNEEYIHELTSQRAVSIDILLKENLSFIQSTAFLYGKSLTSPVADIALIRSFEEASIFDMLRFIDAEGSNYTSSGVAANLADREYFQAGMRGENGITYVLESRVTGERQIGFYAPVEYEGGIIGVMVGFYGENYINNLLEYSLFDNPGEGWLCLLDGTVLGTTLEGETDNYFDYMLNTGRLTRQEIDDMRRELALGETDTVVFSEANSSASGDIVRLNNADWLLVRSFPEAAARQIEANANQEGIRLVLALVCMFVLYFILLIVDIYINHRRTVEANRDANYISTGVRELFESFALIDPEGHTYRLLSGAFGPEGTPSAGGEDEYRNLMIREASGQEEAHAAEEFFRSGALVDSLTDLKQTGIRIHGSDGVCRTHNVVAVERRQGRPTKLLAITQDITELDKKETEDRLRLEAALEESERASQAKTEFLFNMSHDLRTPMNAIIGCTELAQREGVTHAEILEYIHKIDASSRHLLSLINDILEMSRIESGKMTLNPEPGNLIRAIQETEAFFSTQMEAKGIRYSVDTSSVRHAWVEFDPQQLDRILLNLISNAWKFTPGGGSVSVRLTEDGQEDNRVLYTLSVRDSGIGISPEFTSRLFKPFERERTSTVSKTQGTGLGLSITKRIVDLMGGEIECVSEVGKGTEFIVRFRLPAANSPEANALEETAEENFDFTKLNVLLVEDIEINREIAAMALRQRGISVDTAEDGQAAVDKVKAAPGGAYDLVLMDIQMPVMDGYTATRAIRALPDKNKNGIPVIAMTANAFQEDIQEAAEAGMNGHIAKPLDMNKMFDDIAAVLTKKIDLQATRRQNVGEDQSC